MSALERLRQAMEAIGPPVYAFVAPFEDTFPAEYLVLCVVQDHPALYAGDEDTAGVVQLRASWYSRQGHLDHGSRMRRAARKAGFMAKGGFSTYDQSTRHCVQHEEFWIESEE